MSGFRCYVKISQPCRDSGSLSARPENLASRKLSHELSTVMGDVIQLVTFIKSQALNSSLLNQMYSDMGSEYEYLLYYTSRESATETVRNTCRS